ncbi:MAG: hypothetical protein EZS28_015698 [Streblomastix strix]|uniref:SRP9 domain-containing protein n=1 Tax=Streblomastix strix TaxID=222440 RepID=A0A5J4W1N6_9EUKA|nr:MAG: hypothetical protein EZS28_015698 [Streblomastix strix]
MPRTKDFASFVRLSEELVAAYPLKTRIIMKYRNLEKKLVIHVTNDATHLKYTTRELLDSRSIERLMNLFK